MSEPDYASFMVRLWRTQAGEQRNGRVWMGEVESVQTGRTWQFKGVASLGDLPIRALTIYPHSYTTDQGE